MSVTQRSIGPADELDEVLQDLLRDSVRGKAPSAEAREALLHAAAEERQRTLDAFQATQADREAAELLNARRQSAIASSETLGMLQAYLQRMRFVM